MLFLIRNLQETLPLFEVYISFYKKHIRPQIDDGVSYMWDITVVNRDLSAVGLVTTNQMILICRIDKLEQRSMKWFRLGRFHLQL